MYFKVVALLALSCAVLARASCPFADANQLQYYSTYTGECLNDTQVQRFTQENKTGICDIAVLPCDPNEGRRVDGTCNNLNHPSRGGIQTPYYRVMSANYGEDFEPRLAKSGKSLPPPRHVRNNVVLGGKIPNQDMTHLLSYYVVFLLADVSVISDTVNYVFNKTYCCEPEGKEDPICIPNAVGNDDPMLRYSDIRCLNLTRPYSFQIYGCLPNDTVPERANLGSPLMDLGTIYGETQAAANRSRTFEGGLLITEEENGLIWPPSSKSQDNFCILNEGSSETRCHDGPDSRMNTLLGLNLCGIWFWRLHNKIATELAQLNPCWDDDKLFHTTRDMTISISQQIFNYEVLPLWMGRDNLLASGLIQNSTGFRDIYDETLYPRVSLESIYVLRWGHSLINGEVKFYDQEGHYLKSMPVGNLTLRTGYLPLDNNLAGMTQGSFRQPCGAADNVADTDMMTQAMGNTQRVLDLMTNDITKGRYFGFQGYAKYRQYCTGKNYTTFDDLSDVIPQEMIEVLSETYETIDDIDLLSGIWLEKMMPGTQVPPTVYCLAVPQFVRNIQSDRHWYERPNRPNAYTYEQLQEIRKASMARLLCDVGDSVSEIQPAAFRRPRSGNELTSCDNIPKIDLSVWKDDSCSA